MPKSLLPILMLAATLTASSRSFAYALIDLNPGSAAPNLVVAQTEAEQVEVVEVTREQKGYLLALVPVSFPVKVMARADGSLELNYPWYGFMTLSGRAEFEARLRSAVDNARRRQALGSVKAAGEPAIPVFSPAEAEAVRARIALVFDEYAGK